MFSEIAPDVYAVSHRLVGGKNAIVFGEHGALAVDACNYADEGQAMYDFIRSHGAQPDAVCAYLEEDRILCAGDTVVTNIVPAINDGNSHQLESTPCALMRMDIDVVVPGHGPLLCGPTIIREHLEWMVAYLVGIRHCVHQALASGVAPDDVAADTYTQLVGDRFADEPFGMLRRHRMVVKRIVAELEAE